LSIHEQRDPVTGAIMSVFRLTDAAPVPAKADNGT
jgi:hypothetical protein